MCIDQKIGDRRQRTDFSISLYVNPKLTAWRKNDNSQSLIHSPRPLQRGISLVELIMFIVIVGIAVAGILAVMNRVTGSSADTLVRKQALAIAESILEEVELMPFTFCDPDDASAVTATSTAGCTTQEGIGPEAGETRYSTATPFDNVSDYDGCGINTAANPGCDAGGNSGIKDITGTVVGSLNLYNASVAVTPQVIPAVGGSPLIPATESLRITVTVNGPNNETVVLDGYRTRYSPRSVP